MRLNKQIDKQTLNHRLVGHDLLVSTGGPRARWVSTPAGSVCSCPPELGRRSTVRPVCTTSVRPVMDSGSRSDNRGLPDDVDDSLNLASQQSTGITADRAAMKSGTTLTSHTGVMAELSDDTVSS